MIKLATVLCLPFFLSACCCCHRFAVPDNAKEQAALSGGSVVEIPGGAAFVPIIPVSPH